MQNGMRGQLLCKMALSHSRYRGSDEFDQFQIEERESQEKSRAKNCPSDKLLRECVQNWHGSRNLTGRPVQSILLWSDSLQRHPNALSSCVSKSPCRLQIHLGFCYVTHARAVASSNSPSHRPQRLSPDNCRSRSSRCDHVHQFIHAKKIANAIGPDRRQKTVQGRQQDDQRRHEGPPQTPLEVSISVSIITICVIENPCANPWSFMAACATNTDASER